MFQASRDEMRGSLPSHTGFQGFLLLTHRHTFSKREMTSFALLISELKN